MALIISAETVTTNSSTSAVSFTQQRGTIFVTGTFDGATVKLQASADGTNWVDVGEDVTFTEAGVGNFMLFSAKQEPVKIRVNTSGVGTTDVDFYVFDERS